MASNGVSMRKGIMSKCRIRRDGCILKGDEDVDAGIVVVVNVGQAFRGTPAAGTSSSSRMTDTAEANQQGHRAAAER